MLPNCDIQDFVFHIIRKAGERYEIDLLEPMPLSGRAKEFFQNILHAHGEAAKFRFKTPLVPDDRGVQYNVEQIIANPANFGQQAQLIAASFIRFHRIGTSEGILIVTRFYAGDEASRRPYVGIIKYDHENVLRYAAQRGQGAFEEIANALVENKQSVLKIAIIDPAGTEWQLLLKDRQSRLEAARYFSDFLHAEPVVSANFSTKLVVELTQSWALAEQGISSALEKADYQHRAVDYFRTQPRFVLADFLNYVVGPEEQTAVGGLRQNLERFLRENNLTHEFVSDPAGLRKKHTEQRFRTRENVLVIMPDGPRAGNVRQFTDEDGFENIHIRTRHVTTT